MFPRGGNVDVISDRNDDRGGAGKPPHFEPISTLGPDESGAVGENGFGVEGVSYGHFEQWDGGQRDIDNYSEEA